jgi:hypothetical protein
MRIILKSAIIFLDNNSKLLPEILNHVSKILNGLLISLTLALVAAALFGITSTLLGSSADAAETTVVSWKGSASEAYLSSEDNGLHSDVYLYASDSAHRQDSSESSGSVAYVNVYQYRVDEVCDVDEEGQEQCWDEYVNVLAFDGFATLDDAEGFEVQGLSKAALDASITGFDSVSNNSMTIEIDGTWKGFGKTSSENYVSNYRSGDYVFHGKGSGLHRLATFDGSISGDASINLDSGATIFNEGSLLDSKSGYIQITR